jgi:hypothetical protein
MAQSAMSNPSKLKKIKNTQSSIKMGPHTKEKEYYRQINSSNKGKAYSRSHRKNISMMGSGKIIKDQEKLKFNINSKNSRVCIKMM